MLPSDREKIRYVRRVNSNGEDVYPTVCATQYKGVQAQMDRGGYYIISRKRKKPISLGLGCKREKK